MIRQPFNKLKSWAKRLKSDIYALYVAIRDPRTPAHVRWFAIIVVSYALSPIDLIPDFIPVFGLLDDLILLPLGIALLKKMIPPDIMAYSQHRAESLMRSGLPASRNAAMIVVTIWALVLTSVIWWFVNRVISPSVGSHDAPVSISRDTDVRHPGLQPPIGNGATNRTRDRDRN